MPLAQLEMNVSDLACKGNANPPLRVEIAPSENVYHPLRSIFGCYLVKTGWPSKYYHPVYVDTPSLGFPDAISWKLGLGKHLNLFFGIPEAVINFLSKA